MASWCSAKYQKHSAPGSFANRGRLSILYRLQNLRLQRQDIARAWGFRSGGTDGGSLLRLGGQPVRLLLGFVHHDFAHALGTAGIMGFIARHSLCSIPRTVSRVAQILSAVHKRTLSR